MIMILIMGKECCVDLISGHNQRVGHRWCNLSIKLKYINSLFSKCDTYCLLGNTKLKNSLLSIIKY